MRRGLLVLAVVVLTVGTISSVSRAQPMPLSRSDQQAFEAEAVRQTLRSVAEYQLKRYGPNPPTKDWLVGTFFSGMVAAHQATGDAWYREQAEQWSRRSEWDIRNPFDADDVCVGQTYLDLYFLDPQEEKIANLVEKLTPLFDQETLPPGEPHRWMKNERPFIGRHLWWWCDALYMAPPVYARLSVATGDPRFREQMHELFWDSTEFLYDPEERLYYRDLWRFPKDGSTSAKEFWSRGNGWVFAGLARTIPYLPEDDPRREDYLKLFEDMAYRVAELQQPDGLWRAWINQPDADGFEIKEASGTAFFVFGLAKGVNEGWLPREYFMPAIIRGWSGLNTCITPDGRLTHVQRVGSAPAPVRPWDSADYAIGGTLLAGSEVYKLAQSGAVPSNPELTGFLPRVVADDGAFTWYNDERAILAGPLLLVNYVKRDGRTAMSVFGDLHRTFSESTKAEVVLSSWAEKDDHNNGAMLWLGGKERRVLATYARHGGRSVNFGQRYLDFDKDGFNARPRVSDERSFDVVTTKRGLTYQNLIQLSDEGNGDGRIYNFFRGDNFNPAFVFSDDAAQTWSEPIQLIRAGSNSSQRPYVKYADNGTDRIDLFYSEAHPRAAKDNSLYHAYYQAGTFYKSDGTPIRTMAELRDNPLTIEDGTLLFDGSTESGRGWVWDLELNESSEPQAAFISSPSGDIGTDMRYWVATWRNGEWRVEGIGYAGSNLYPKEQHYAGGITLDPYDPNRVVVSADVHPGTGEPLPQRVYQLFKGHRDSDGTWTWDQLTFEPVHDQLRPFLVRGRPDTLVWFAGEYVWYGSYRTKVMASWGL
ncbi:MAG: glycoside hydrolase family 88 protein [Planctomycetota bacterium]